MSSHNVQEELRKARLQPRGSVAVAADALVIPITHSVVEKTTGTDAEALTLANGSPGQELTITLVAIGGGSGVGTLTPTTMTGFSTLLFAIAKDTVTLKYIDDTVGWIIIGAIGTTAATLPVIS